MQNYKKLQEVELTESAAHDEEKKEEDKCPVCLEKYTGNKVILKCNHSICYECMKTYERAKIDKCPVCRESIIFSGDLEKSSEPMEKLKKIITVTCIIFSFISFCVGFFFIFYLFAGKCNKMQFPPECTCYNCDHTKLVYTRDNCICDKGFQTYFNISANPHVLNCYQKNT